MTVVRVELPDALVAAAEAEGLLSAEGLGRVLTRALDDHRAAAAFLAVPDRLSAMGVEPMSMQEINAEVKSLRAARRRAGGL